MKLFLPIVFFFLSLMHYSQENSPESTSKNLDKTAYYKLGEKKLQKEFNRALSFAVDQNYNVNGVLTFAIYINDAGLAKIIDVKPKVKNHQLLLDDLNYVLRKTHKNWEAAVKNNQKVSSIYYYEITFNTEVYDHD